MVDQIDTYALMLVVSFRLRAMPKPRMLPNMPLRTRIAKYLLLLSATSELSQPTSGTPIPLFEPITVWSTPGVWGFGVGSGKSSPWPTLKKALTRPSKLKRKPSFSASTTSLRAVRHAKNTGKLSKKHAPRRFSRFRLFTRSPLKLCLVRYASCFSPVEGCAGVDVTDDLL